MDKNDTQNQLTKESIFKIGSVFSVSGRSIKIKVNKNKNASHLIFNGDVLKNTSVNSYVKITKGFTKIIGKVDGEYIQTSKVFNKEYNKEEDFIERFLEVSLFGHFEGHKFEQGIKEMPLVDNECYLLDREEFDKLHQFYEEKEKTITLGSLADEPAQEIKVAINKLFASHIGIFGNTGSGKSNTLAKIYFELFKKMEEENGNFQQNSKFVIIDFNGEYGKNKDEIITKNKHVYNLSTRKESGKDKIPLKEFDLIDIELISILANATEKAQKPFIERALNLYKKVHTKKGDNIEEKILNHFKNSLRDQLIKVYKMVSREKANLLLDNFENILKQNDEDSFIRLGWHSGGAGKQDKGFIPSDYGEQSREESIRYELVDDDIKETPLYKAVDDYSFPGDLITKLVHFLYLRLIYDIYDNRAQDDHISPAINKLKSRQKDIEKILDTQNSENFFQDGKNLVVVNLKETNTETKKTLPLLLAKKLYEEHKNDKDFKNKSLHFIIDEAHNILSDKSGRESESWKDYRLETFEEIIKEGRKFNTFLTIASQRPQDISSTMISQLHNYFIHKLLNDYDISAIHKTVVYLDSLSFESIPILSVGNCFFAGISTNLPVKVAIDPLDEINRPSSENVNLEKIWKA